MKPTTIVAALASIALLAACDTQTDPAQPPTSEPALTTASAAPPPPDDTQTTTEAAPTTVAPTEEADGPPQMPEEATEQSQDGAIAFAGHFIEVVNFTGIDPTPGMITELSTDDCETCLNLEETVVYSLEHEHFLQQDLWTVEGDAEVLVFSPDSTVVQVPIRENGLPVVDAEGNEVDRVEEAVYTMALDLTWSGGWSVASAEFE